MRFAIWSICAAIVIGYSSFGESNSDMLAADRARARQILADSLARPEFRTPESVSIVASVLSKLDSRIIVRGKKRKEGQSHSRGGHAAAAFRFPKAVPASPKLIILYSAYFEMAGDLRASTLIHEALHLSHWDWDECLVGFWEASIVGSALSHNLPNPVFGDPQCIGAYPNIRKLADAFPF